MAPPAAAAVVTPAVPTWLSLPSLGVEAPVERVVTSNGILGVPQDIASVGWWTGSRLAGSRTGTTVIDGHVDSAVAGLGALSRLGQLTAGEIVSLTTQPGSHVRYRVYARHVYRKHDGLPADLFTTTGPPRLVLITCGGPFDHTTRSYEDNIVVFARPT